MDPVTQGALGSVFALCKAKKKEITAAIWLGALSGMAADLDVLIQSNKDPMVYFEFHRHFTHSLAFIPIGALICHLVLFPLIKRLIASDLDKKSSYLFCFLGYASHGILDACTSYGTQLLWPFSNHRVAWDIVSIIDPAFTLPLIAMVVVSRLRKNMRWGIYALAYALLYMGLASWQHTRVIGVLRELAISRGHTSLPGQPPFRVHAKPSFANLILYRGLYEYQDHFYVDAIRLPFFGKPRVYEGSSKKRVHPEDIYADTNSQGYVDLKKFEWFSDGFLVQSNMNPLIINDFRYAILPNGDEELWGVYCDPSTPSAHVKTVFDRKTDSSTLKKFKLLLWGE